MKYTNIGLQLMPMVFIVCSVAFFALNSVLFASACFVLGMLFAFVLLGENLKD